MKGTENIGRVVSLAVFYLLACVPLLLGMGYALLYSLGLTGLLSEGFSYAYYLAVLRSASFYSSLWYSFYTAVISLGLAIIPAFLLSLPSVFSDRHKPSAWLYIPLSIPPLVMALVVFALFSSAGWLSSISAYLGLTATPEDFPALVHDRFGLGIIITHIFLLAPFLTLLFLRLAAQERLYALYLLGRTLGAGKVDFARKVWIPLLMRKAFPVFWLYFIFCFGMYEVALVNGVSFPRAFSVLVADKLSRYDLATRPEGYAMAFIYGIAIVGISAYVFRKRRLSA